MIVVHEDEADPPRTFLPGGPEADVPADERLAHRVALDPEERAPEFPGLAGKFEEGLVGLPSVGGNGEHGLDQGGVAGMPGIDRLEAAEDLVEQRLGEPSRLGVRGLGPEAVAEVAVGPLRREIGVEQVEAERAGLRDQALERVDHAEERHGLAQLAGGVEWLGVPFAAERADESGRIASRTPSNSSPKASGWVK